MQSPDIVVDDYLHPTPPRAIPENDPLVIATVGEDADSTGTSYFAYETSQDESFVVSLRHKPLRVQVYRHGLPVGIPFVSVFDREMGYFEHRQVRPEASTEAKSPRGSSAESKGRIIGWGEDGKPVYDTDAPVDPDADAFAHSDSATSKDAKGSWQESFQTHVDTRPYGPMSVGGDIAFPLASHVYGLPEHASALALFATDGTEKHSYTQPYRLYNLDVFEYELDNAMALYGAVPFLIGHGPSGLTTGVFWNNPSETFVDISKSRRGKVLPEVGIDSHWMSESGVIDLHIVPGPSAKEVLQQFTDIVGKQGMPAAFALGYHQCRWNYKDEADVYAIDAKFYELAFPYDVLWLDIEHTNGKRYFTWDSNTFPNPVEMQNHLWAGGHRMVTIVDPHIKRDRDYHVYAEAREGNFFVRDSKGDEFDGWCWPGSSAYVDFTNPAVRNWWADLFQPDKYQGSTASLYTWNDMNEPSVFNGPEVSMSKDAVSTLGIEHREWHNLYGIYQMMSTHEGHIRRHPEKNTRSFVLSRAFYAGSQRYGAIWTGDNAADWTHLRISAPMLMGLGLGGIAFGGADVGGFFNNPSAELLIRWYQAGAWQPFFRAHAHIDTARREPWLFGDEAMQAMRTAVRTRYSYLPLWYTLFAHANVTGVPPMRPMWMEYPLDFRTFTMDDQWLVGSDILVKPVYAPSTEKVMMYVPPKTSWYRAETLELEVSTVESKEGREVIFPAPLEALPVLQRGGSIVPRQLRSRRSTEAMKEDPYSLYIALDTVAGSATGTLYMDDGITYDFARNQAFQLRRFDYSVQSDTLHTIASTLENGSSSYQVVNGIERIVVGGVQRKPIRVALSNEATISVDGSMALRHDDIAFDYDETTNVLVLRKPDVQASQDWSIYIQF